ncbi:MAG: winged helix-turn-helix transcriptional regulator [Acidimicrobiia bacterium]|nr:winged helix-turn-helix transcriptional regulator [Acidimicrobiia bacterium]
MATGSLDRTFSALGDPVRRSIVQSLLDRPATVGEIADPFEMSRPAVSKHLRVLREAGIVESRAIGRQNWYSVRPDALDEASHWLDGVHAMWATALGSLKDYLEEERNGDGE